MPSANSERFGRRLMLGSAIDLLTDIHGEKPGLRDGQKTPRDTRCDGEPVHIELHDPELISKAWDQRRHRFPGERVQYRFRRDHRWICEVRDERHKASFLSQETRYRQVPYEPMEGIPTAEAYDEPDDPWSVQEMRLFEKLEEERLTAFDKLDRPIPSGVWRGASTEPGAPTLVRYVGSEGPFGDRLEVAPTGSGDSTKAVFDGVWVDSADLEAVFELAKVIAGRSDLSPSQASELLARVRTDPPPPAELAREQCEHYLIKKMLASSRQRVSKAELREECVRRFPMLSEAGFERARKRALRQVPSEIRAVWSAEGRIPCSTKPEKPPRRRQFHRKQWSALRGAGV